jgi:hypothetical protein
MSQADADLDTIGWDDPGQADAGAEVVSSATEARASEVSSEHNAVPDDDAIFAVDPGRAGDSVEQDDDEAALAQYYADMAEVVEAGPTPDELQPRESAIDWGEEVAEVPATPGAEVDPFAELVEPAPTADDSDGPGKDPQFRLRPRSELDKLAFGFMKVDPTLELADAVAMAQQRLGVAPAAPAAGEDHVTSEDQPSTVTSVAELQKQIKALRIQRNEAHAQYDTATAADLDNQMLALEEQIPFIQAREAEEAAQRDAEDQAWTDAARQHIALVHRAFPTAADPNSAFATRMREIDEAWGEANDERFDDPAKAVTIAKIVSRELGVRPVTAGKPAGPTLPATASSRSTQQAPARPGSIATFAPISGAARTTSDPTEATRIERAIEQVRDVDEYVALRDALFDKAG